jgi:hypothetical protein
MHVAGKINGAFDYDGTSDYVDTGVTLQNTFRDSFSICSWFKLGDLQKWHVICGVIADAEQSHVVLLELQQFAEEAIYRVAGTYKAGYYTGVVAEGFPDSFLAAPANWHSAVFTITKKSSTSVQADIYFNGVLINSAIVDGIVMADFTSSVTLPIGADRISDGSLVENEYFGGSLDNLMIFNKALTQDEINQIYNETNTYNNLNSTGEKLFTSIGV